MTKEGWPKQRANPLSMITTIEKINGKHGLEPHISSSFAKKFSDTIMNTPLITWCCVAGLLTAVVLAHSIIYLAGRKHKRKKIFGIASEREILFIPGDNTENDDYDCED
jgi:hypothetical protein